ncbi:helix-turn-helix transcriptional regulator [Flavobacteriaceae bacterium]|nr:helix-turn-helix transcriptional regulator [Flavobacteriaceae bacterium]MDB2632201.1 helix-turn-helix transcriptional regulator [Flavobacteriaceae bacterium]
MKKNRSNCPLTSALDIVGDKWSLLIIRDIFLGKKTFTEFLKSPEKIATNILSNRLELLINNGLLNVTKLPNDQKTKIYYLTDAGIEMYPIIYEMMQWSKNNLKKKFGPIGEQWFKDIEGLQPKSIISDTTTTYKKSRKAILSQMV